LLSSAASDDAKFIDLAISHSKKVLGRTFPNHAVGCVLVRQDTNDVIGAGFHPRAGRPHAEVFALLEASGHVPNGIDAAMSIVNEGDEDLTRTVQQLTQQYVENGPQALFGGTFSSMPVTAYVTLEPCCHVGKTPPCAASLVASKVDRVVVGLRDPNPRVDGGGVTLLQEAGIAVDVVEGKHAEECAHLVTNFIKRITPRDCDYEHVNGAQRRALRSLAGRHKAENTLAVQPWPSTGPSVTTDGDFMAAVDALPLDPSWLEAVDAILWESELIQLKLGKAIAKKKGAKRLGERVAQELNAHVAQAVGHTVLLYRPGIPPVLD
jgi:diaminohydroxyphosphoribosylaminopyrimidine deaminase/5-amino-6-(5-phosphoribosylamino)uracil reductase